MDFVYSTCVSNSLVPALGGCGNFRFASTAVIALPDVGTGSKVFVNVNNTIVQSNGGNGVLLALTGCCRPLLTEHYNEVTGLWSALTPDLIDITDVVYLTGGGDADGLRIEARTTKSLYAQVRSFLQGKRVRASVTCKGLADSCVEFMVSNTGVYTELRSSANDIQSTVGLMLGMKFHTWTIFVLTWIFFSYFRKLAWHYVPSRCERAC